MARLTKEQSKEKLETIKTLHAMGLSVDTITVQAEVSKPYVYNALKELNLDSNKNFWEKFLFSLDPEILEWIGENTSSAFTVSELMTLLFTEKMNQGKK